MGDIVCDGGLQVSTQGTRRRKQVTPSDLHGVDELELVTEYLIGFVHHVAPGRLLQLLQPLARIRAEALFLGGGERETRVAAAERAVPRGSIRGGVLSEVET
jgi:hypothetical protein